MKAKILFLFLVFTTVVSARTYYVAPTGGSDFNIGSLSQPWASWQRAFNTAQAGDTVFFRGGIWYPKVGLYINPSGGKGYNGTRENPICYFNYPGEIPIVDFSDLPVSEISTSGLDVYEAKYLKFKGLTFKSVHQTTNGQWISGIHFTRCGVLHLENIISTDHGGTGMFIAGYDTLYLINCDSYNNIDSTTTSALKGGRADGYNITSGGTENDLFRIAYITGCRSWFNSDDGFDISSTKQFEISNCWSFSNGRLQGDGVGFKFSYSDVKTSKKRRIYNTISAYNVHDGYSEVNLVNVMNGPVCEYLNNTAYKNETGFFSATDRFDCENGYGSVIYYNNLVYNSLNSLFDQTHLFACNYKYPKYTIQKSNTWIPYLENPYWRYNPSFSVTDGDFAPIDLNQLSSSRKPDGSLPDITFLILRDGSELIDKGIDVGLAFNGIAPDIGASEYAFVPGTSNMYPRISIKLPHNYSIFSDNDIEITSIATDPDGTIIKVEYFYNDSIKIGESNSYPWSFTWANAPFGNHSLRAVVTDNMNAKSTSERVYITIRPGIDNPNNSSGQILGFLFPNPNDGHFKLSISEPFQTDGLISITILSVEGKIIYKGTMFPSEILVEFDLSYISPGLYFLFLSNNEILLNNSFIKQ